MKKVKLKPLNATDDGLAVTLMTSNHYSLNIICPRGGEERWEYWCMKRIDNNVGGIVRCGKLNIRGWHNRAKEVIDPCGISTCISTQSNNLLQKIIMYEET